MKEFVWADLSSYDPAKSKIFYEQVFGWTFHDAGGYMVAMQGSTEIAGLFETPEFFKNIRMPHFWMSYIAVDDALATAELASEFGNATVEMTDQFYGGQIALIRDPQGAGFTVYDGGKFASRKIESGHMVWNELHVSDATGVIPFYERLFGWRIQPNKSRSNYAIFNKEQEQISQISVIPNSVKGKYEYWVCTFAVDNLGQAKARVEQQGGGVVFDEGERIMMHDDSGEAFFYIQCPG